MIQFDYCGLGVLPLFRRRCRYPSIEPWAAHANDKHIHCFESLLMIIAMMMIMTVTSACCSYLFRTHEDSAANTCWTRSYRLVHVCMRACTAVFFLYMFDRFPYASVVAAYRAWGGAYRLFFSFWFGLLCFAFVQAIVCSHLLYTLTRLAITVATTIIARRNERSERK